MQYNIVKSIIICLIVVFCGIMIKDPIGPDKEFSAWLAFITICAITGWLSSKNIERKVLQNKLKYVTDEQLAEAKLYSLCKIHRITYMDSHLFHMYKSWESIYKKHSDIWSAIQNWSWDSLIHGNAGIILHCSDISKKEDIEGVLFPDSRVKEDMEILNKLGIELQISDYTYNSGVEKDKKDTDYYVRVWRCEIPEWMIGLTKEEILKEYEDEANH